MSMPDRQPLRDNFRMPKPVSLNAAFKRTRSLVEQADDIAAELETPLQPNETPPTFDQKRFMDEIEETKVKAEGKRLDEIASLVRSLTYGEMMELAAAIWNVRPDDSVTEKALPDMLHKWSRGIPKEDGNGMA